MEQFLSVLKIIDFGHRILFYGLPPVLALAVITVNFHHEHNIDHTCRILRTERIERKNSGMQEAGFKNCNGHYMNQDHTQAMILHLF